MDEERYLILIKSKDRTSDIASYEQMGLNIQVTYKSSPKVYNYSATDVVILNNPVIKEITRDLAIFNRDNPLINVTRLLDFGPRARVVFRNGTNKVYETKHVRVESSGVKNSDARMIMDYWRAISGHIKNGEEQPDMEAFVKREFAKLTFVDSDSVLSHYVNVQPVKADNLVDFKPIFPFRYNLSQKTALEHAMSSKISIIEGPPGTGKTQTILNILANLTVMQQKTVAVVSGNNAAVQNVRDKLEAEGYPFLVAALGNKENKKSFFENLSVGDVSGWKSDRPESEMLSKVQELDGRITRLMDLDVEKARLKQQLSAYVLEQKHFENYYTKQDVQHMEKLSFYRETPERILEFMKDSHFAVRKGKENGLFYKFKLFVKHGFTELKYLKEQGGDVILNFQRKFYTLRIEELSGRIDQIEKELHFQSYQSLLEQHQQNSAQLFRHRLYEKYRDLPKVECNAKNYIESKNFKSFIDYYPIVLSTTHSLRNCIPANYLFDYVIIDESSQVDLVTGALSLSCCKRAIIVGDTKQLPQIVDMEIEQIVGDAASVGFDEAFSYFQHNLLSSMIALYGDDIPKVMLKEHYRCHPKIIQFCNLKYYNGDLITFTAEEDTDVPLLIYRTAPGNHMREVTQGKKGKFNQRELDVIEGEVLAGLEEVAASHTDIGFATPYRKQVEKASVQFEEDIESDTIHKYQGREKPIMVMSTVLDRTRSGKIGIKFVDDPCKINVAVSRAQKQFILVTDHTLFRKYGNEIGDLTRYMEYSTLDDNVVESEVVSIFDLLYQEYSDKLQVFRERAKGINVSKYKSENLMQALLKDILQEPAYNGFILGNQILLKNLFLNVDRLEEHERRYVRNRSSVDFVIYHKLDKTAALAIEVDGFSFHENKPEQLKRDEMKDSIFEKYGMKLERFATNESSEEQKIRRLLDTIVQSS
ncbi:AAA domain-containing protein [Paenibacillus wynnii]|uniref:AAA domain-containing protein n=1 Tax=Paenibacillus wynnii TaxID=268407 RepID=UPI0027920312|nr:AAA domain-containing protein [Paenibacillus wynnii]MDQ0195733.1 very-short-patch-repair endonuclease [Paenibacillus wynnii]